MAAPSATKEIGPGNPYYTAICKACIHEGGPVQMIWAGTNWTRIRRNNADWFVNAGPQSAMDKATGGNSFGANGTGDMTGATELEQGPGIVKEGITMSPMGREAFGLPAVTADPEAKVETKEVAPAKNYMMMTEYDLRGEMLNRKLEPRRGNNVAQYKAYMVMDLMRDDAAKRTAAQAIANPYTLLTDDEKRALIMERLGLDTVAPELTTAQLITILDHSAPENIPAEDALIINKPVESPYIRDVAGLRTLYDAMTDHHIWEVCAQRRDANFWGGRDEVINQLVDYEYAHLMTLIDWRHNEMIALTQPTLQDQLNDRIANADLVTDYVSPDDAVQSDNTDHDNFIADDEQRSRIAMSPGGGWQHNVKLDANGHIAIEGDAEAILAEALTIENGLDAEQAAYLAEYDASQAAAEEEAVFPPPKATPPKPAAKPAAKKKVATPA